jgi:hypothetical protein
MEQSSDGGEVTSMAVIKCRLYQRGEGWATLQQRYLKHGAGNSVLVERNVLVQPDMEDVVVYRYFNLTDETVEEDPPSN